MQVTEYLFEIHARNADGLPDCALIYRSAAYLSEKIMRNAAARELEKHPGAVPVYISRGGYFCDD